MGGCWTRAGMVRTMFSSPAASLLKALPSEASPNRFVGIDFPDPWEDPKSRSLNGGSYKVPLVV